MIINNGYFVRDIIKFNSEGVNFFKPDQRLTGSSFYYSIIWSCVATVFKTLLLPKLTCCEILHYYVKSYKNYLTQPYARQLTSLTECNKPNTQSFN